MSDKLQFDPEELPPLDDLLAIASITDSNIAAASEAWRSDPPDPDFELSLRPQKMNEFFYDPKSQRYRYADTRKFVSQAAVESLTQKAIAQTQRDLKTVGQLLIDRKINVAIWEETTAKTLKTLLLVSGIPDIVEGRLRKSNRPSTLIQKLY